MRWLPVALLVGCSTPVEPIRFPVVDDPPFQVWEADSQVGTVLVSEQRGTLPAPIPVVLGLFAPAGEATLYAQVDEDRGCRLYDQRGPFFCDPACEEGSTCVDGECREPPPFVDAGRLTVEGQDAYELAPSPNYLFYGTGPVYESPGGDDLFGPDASIHVSAAGAEFPGFTGTVAGVEPLDADIEPGGIVMVPGIQDFVVRWDAPEAAPDDAAVTRVRLTLRTGETGHGAPPWHKLVCDVPDTGLLVVPGLLLSRLPRMVLPDLDREVACVGACAWSPSSLTRYRAESVPAADGAVEIVAASEILFWAYHPGPEPLAASRSW
ncbi:MAG TPA: hypothetical protein VK698_21585 [Kofleriaceae bacterium]|nr:hypothetical protein [Kofleriaceae bacterium]